MNSNYNRRNNFLLLSRILEGFSTASLMSQTIQRRLLLRSLHIQYLFTYCSDNVFSDELLQSIESANSASDHLLSLMRPNYYDKFVMMKVLLSSCRRIRRIIITGVVLWDIVRTGISIVEDCKNYKTLKYPKESIRSLLSISGGWMCGSVCTYYGSKLCGYLGTKISLLFHSVDLELFRDIGELFGALMGGLFGAYYGSICTEFIAADKVAAFLKSKFNDKQHTLLLIKEKSGVELVNLPNKYVDNFTECCLLGFGGFSTVFKSSSKLKREFYAIKKISIDESQSTIEHVHNELAFLSTLDQLYVVKYFDSWLEKNYYIGNYQTTVNTNPQLSKSSLLYDPNKPLLLHIQMELCAFTLRQAINKIREFKDNELVVYYIASELMIEILECVQYLHEQTPAIIHRDLKPENILINDFGSNRFVKLSDFGLSTFHEFADQSHTKYAGTKNYRANEVNLTSKYTTKSDIYSLGIIMQELFDIDFTKNYDNINDSLSRKFKFVENLIRKRLLSLRPDSRPDCSDILNNSSHWSLAITEIKSDPEFEHLMSNSNNISFDYNFIEFFLHSKGKLSI